MTESFRFFIYQYPDGEWFAACGKFPTVYGSGESMWAALEDFTMRVEQDMERYQQERQSDD
jgi:predicted RNase H-like HicB family nuclease